uniref:Homing endonuclease n=1 Tax=viral metagenome TaxID=1070528 RepID=A0A6M3ITA6_9ZZZZ
MPKGIKGFQKGHSIWVNRKHSEKTKKKMGKSKKEMIFSKEHRRKLRLKRKGRKCTLGKRWKLSIEKIQNRQGKNNSMFGKHHSEETKEKQRKYRGPLSSNWQGGISFEPYTIDWTETLRRAIRERDNYVCQICNKLQGDIAHDVHHKDYNKKNCNPDNLITLCRRCHMKTNGKNREYWIKYFNNK